MAVYNTEMYLRQSIESVIQQTFTNWELIIIDDGSTDQSASICDEMAANDARIKVIHKKNSGQADSRNLAIEMAQGDFIGFVDSDDWIEPSMYERMFAYQQQHGADAVVCSYSEEYTNCSLPHIIDQKRIGLFDNKDIVRIFYAEQINVLWACLLKRELLQERIPNYRFMEDSAVLIQWFSHAAKTVQCPDMLYHYRMRKGSVMHIERQLDRELTNMRVTNERSLFVQHLNILPCEYVVLREIKEYLHFAKDFVRTNKKTEECKVLVKEACSLLKAANLSSSKSLSLRDFLRITMLKNHPLFFIFWIRLTGVFSSHRNKIALESLFD